MRGVSMGNPSISVQRNAVEQAFLPAMTAFIRASSRNAGTNAGMAASKGCSTVGITAGINGEVGTAAGLRATPELASQYAGTARLLVIAVPSLHFLSEGIMIVYP